MALKRSAVWYHFEEIQPGLKAKCKICKATYSTKNNSVGNIRRHLRLKHPTIRLAGDDNEFEMDTDEPAELPEHTPDPIPSSSRENRSSSNSTNVESPVVTSNRTTVDVSQNTMPQSTRTTSTKITSFFRTKKPVSVSLAKSLNTQLIRFITRGYYPFSIVEDLEFQKLLNMLCPGYTLPSRKTLSDGLLVQAFNDCKRDVEKKLEGVSAVCLTTDGWTSINNDSFVAVTAHFITDTDRELTLDSALLSCEEFGLRHTGDNIADYLTNVIKEWKIEGRVSVIVTDNGANMVSAITGRWKHLPCFAHTLNLMVRSAWKEPTILKILEKVKGDFSFKFLSLVDFSYY